MLLGIMARASANPPAHISRHLVGVSSALRLHVSDGLRERGHVPSAATTHIVPNLPPDGLGVSALAARAHLSVQRAGQLVQQLEDEGYVERVADESDGRARRVVYTRRGRRLLADIEDLLTEITARFTGVLGKRGFERLRNDLRALDHALNGEEAGVRIVLG
jgi:DNA-binding MarR family transcriptional regulator